MSRGVFKSKEWPLPWMVSGSVMTNDPSPEWGSKGKQNRYAPALRQPQV